MIEMKCCGVNDYNDFSQSDSWNQHRGNKTVPEACCIQSINREGESRPRDDACTISPSESNSYYKQVSSVVNRCPAMVSLTTSINKIFIPGMLRSPRQLDAVESKSHHYGYNWHRYHWTFTHILHLLSVQIDRQISCDAIIDRIMWTTPNDIVIFFFYFHIERRFLVTE